MFRPAPASKSDRRSSFAHHHARPAQKDGRRSGAPRARRWLRQRRHGRIPSRCQSQFLFFGSEYTLAGRASRHRQVTGLDLVKLQIAIAAGHRLPFAWESITPRGHAMEVRLYAEDPDNNFFPSPGKILSRRVPSGPGIRLDDGVYEGWTVPNDYDPLLSKLIAWGNSREETIARLRRALDEYTITAIKTTVRLFRPFLTEPTSIRATTHTNC